MVTRGFHAVDFRFGWVNATVVYAFGTTGTMAAGFLAGKRSLGDHRRTHTGNAREMAMNFASVPMMSWGGGFLV